MKKLTLLLFASAMVALATPTTAFSVGSEEKVPIEASIKMAPSAIISYTYEFPAMEIVSNSVAQTDVLISIEVQNFERWTIPPIPLDDLFRCNQVVTSIHQIEMVNRASCIRNKIKLFKHYDPGNRSDHPNDYLTRFKC